MLKGLWELLLIAFYVLAALFLVALVIAFVLFLA